MCHKELDWKISLEHITKANIRVTYNVKEVKEKEALDFVWKLESEGIVSEVHMKLKGFFSPIMFLRKANQSKVRKVVDFRLLNDYPRTWKTISLARSPQLGGYPLLREFMVQ